MQSLLRVLAVAALCCPIAPLFSAAPPRPAVLDRFGDPLPDGAVARIGSARLRHVGLGHLVLAADGKTAISCGSDRVVRHWDITNGKQTHSVRLRGERGPGRTLVLSPDGKTLAAHDRDRFILWDAVSGPVAPLEGQGRRGVACPAARPRTSAPRFPRLNSLSAASSARPTRVPD